MDGPVIEIRRAGDEFMVAVEPPHPDHPPEVFTTMRRAFGFACGKRMVTGWAKRDCTQESALGEPR